MALIDLKFEDDEQEVQPTEPGKIELQFEGQGDSDVPLAPGSTGYAAPVDQSLPENIRDWFMEGYTRTKQSIAQQKGLMLDEDYEDRSRTGARVKELERTAGKYGPDLDLMQKMQGLNEVETFGEGMSMILTDPELLGYLTVSSAGRFAPAMAATVGIGMAGGPTAAMVGTTGVGSLFIEYSATVDETMREAGMDATDPTSWMQFSQDEELQARAQERGLIRGIPIAAMDAFSMGLAGRLLAGAKPTATSVLTRSAGEVIQQSTTGALGELGAQAGEITFGHREDFSPGEIAAEAAAELGPGFAETIAGYSSQKQAAMRRQAAEQAGADAAQRVADQKLTPDFEVHSLEDNETAIDEALAAAPPTPEVRPDEESITEKFGLEQEVEQAQPELGLDSESLQAEQEANAFVLKQLRSQFPNASENELLAAIEANKPAREELPTEEDLGWVAPEEAAPAAPAAEITPKPEQPKPDTEIPSKEDLGWVAPEEIETPAFAQITPKPEQPGTAAEWGPVKEITRDEVVQATEPVESTGDAIEAAE
ncbi:MAG: hypothetical protein GY815_12995, partial [Gammaproteobacteria bacterium]|nr:hypothetical protein [Gammaproteobacteria bacterium]